MRSNRGNFAKNPTDLIRRKFSIDVDFHGKFAVEECQLFRNHIEAAVETSRSPSPLNETVRPRDLSFCA
jgi:hypothetical protein